MDKRTRKRWAREHSKRTAKTTSSETGGVRTRTMAEFSEGEDVQIVYRPKTEAERQRRVDRAESLTGTPFISMPGFAESRQDHETLFAFTTSKGTNVTVADVEMVFNDALLTDAISNWGEDGPLYRDTIQDEMLEVYNWALEAYKGVEIPQQLRPPPRKL